MRAVDDGAAAAEVAVVRTSSQPSARRDAERVAELPALGDERLRPRRRVHADDARRPIVPTFSTMYMSPFGASASPAGSTSRFPELTSDCWPVTGSTPMRRPSGLVGAGGERAHVRHEQAAVTGDRDVVRMTEEVALRAVAGDLRHPPFAGLAPEASSARVPIASSQPSSRRRQPRGHRARRKPLLEGVTAKVPSGGRLCNACPSDMGQSGPLGAPRAALYGLGVQRLLDRRADPLGELEHQRRGPRRPLGAVLRRSRSTGRTRSATWTAAARAPAGPTRGTRA